MTYISWRSLKCGRPKEEGSVSGFIYPPVFACGKNSPSQWWTVSLGNLSTLSGFKNHRRPVQIRTTAGTALCLLCLRKPKPDRGLLWRDQADRTERQGQTLDCQEEVTVGGPHRRLILTQRMKRRDDLKHIHHAFKFTICVLLHSCLDVHVACGLHVDMPVKTPWNAAYG